MKKLPRMAAEGRQPASGNFPRMPAGRLTQKRSWLLGAVLMLAGATGVALNTESCSEQPRPAEAPRPEPDAGPVDAGLKLCPDPAATRSDPYADCIVQFRPASPASFGHDRLPTVVLGRPFGGGPRQGGVDVASLGCGGEIVLAFDGQGIPDELGVDLLVFENPFLHSTERSESSFVEPAEVSVSADGETWFTFPCAAGAGGSAAGCAGLNPVLASSENGIDPTDPRLAGGDGFDLADLGLRFVRYVRLRDRSDLHHGLSSPYCQGEAAGFDLDAVAAVHTR